MKRLRSSSRITALGVLFSFCLLLAILLLLSPGPTSAQGGCPPGQSCCTADSNCTCRDNAAPVSCQCSTDGQSVCGCACLSGNCGVICIKFFCNSNLEPSQEVKQCEGNQGGFLP